MTSPTYPAIDLPSEVQPAIRGVTRRLVEEFEGIFSAETVTRAVAGSCQAYSDAKSTAFVPLFVERFTRQRLRGRARSDGTLAADIPLVVFLCVHNAGRSQMAAGWLEHLSGGRIEVVSGGSDPASEVNPAAVSSMAEVGIDIASQFPKPWTDDVLRAADVIVTMGCGDACPVFPGTKYLDWQVSDPAGLPVDEVGPIRDDIEARVRGLMADLGIAAVN